jgi:(R,R)-butanediol dehydrogenase / meso-butanediol dehydrogenase / diacetyl reductase
MRAAVYRGRGLLSIEEVPRPTDPERDEVQLKVTRAAVCGTDSAEWDHGPVLAVPPVILGHEFTGEIVAVGSDVTRFKAGERVVSGAGVSCGTCEWCLEGRTNLCSSYHTLGLHVDGGLAEYVNVPAATLMAVPDDLSDDAATLAQPQSVAMHSVRRSGVKPGETLAVIGVGGIGAFIISAARAIGVTDLIALDIDAERLQTASKLGASKTVDVSETDLVDAIRGAAGPAGPHVIIEATGAAHAPAAAFQAVRRGGRVLLVGLHNAPREVDLLSLIVREVDVTTTLAHVLAEDLADSLEVLRTTNVFDIVVDKVIGLEELLDQGILPLAQRRAKGKIIVDVTR